MMKGLFRTGDVIGLNKRSSAFLFLFTICLLTGIYESKANTTRDPLVITLTCPSDVTINCGTSTLPPGTGNPTVDDPCDPTPNINYYDYPYTPPANGEEMRWVILPPGSNGSCTSGTNCSTGTICCRHELHRRGDEGCWRAGTRTWRNGRHANGRRTPLHPSQNTCA